MKILLDISLDLYFEKRNLNYQNIKLLNVIINFFCQPIIISYHISVMIISTTSINDTTSPYHEVLVWSVSGFPDIVSCYQSTVHYNVS